MHRTTLFSPEDLASLRIKIITSYPREVAKQHIEPTNISSESFTQIIVHWLCYANTPYGQKKNQGIYYPDDYVKYCTKSRINSESIYGLAHSRYWHLKSAPVFLFRAQEDCPPSQALNAFFVGPTLAECGTTLQACMYRAIEEMIGTKEFDRIFNTSLTPFLITSSLFFKIQSNEELPGIPLEGRLVGGNPLKFLFDEIETKNEQEINTGDIVYIRGVNKYSFKHVAGFGQGWNVICVGKNNENENLYLGFGPETFAQPLTYKEIQAVLIKLYNLDLSIDTLAKIQSTKKSLSNLDHTKRDLIETQLHSTELLANHKIGENHPIQGIEKVIRFNPKKLQLFLNAQPTGWHAISKEIEPPSSIFREAQIKQVTQITQETKGKSLSNYKVETETQAKMLFLAKQFALATCSERSTPVGLIMTGMPGIGKSHLSVAVADYASKQGLHVVFVDEKTIDNLYQKFCEQGHDPNSKILEEFKNWLNEADLIVMDDINSKYGIGADFLKMAIQYTMQNNKALMINANQPFYFLKENLPDYIGYDSEKANGFFVIQELKGESYRQEWWSTANLNSSSGKLESTQDAMEILVNLTTNQGVGMILEEKERTLESIRKQYMELSPDKNIKIRMLRQPYKDGKVFDFYIHDADQYDVFIMRADTHGECGQLLELVPHIHNSGKKLIVVTQNEEEILSLLDKELNSILKRQNKERLTDRVNNLLLKKSDWPSVSVKPCDPVKPSVSVEPQDRVSPSVSVTPYDSVAPSYQRCTLS